MRWGKKRWWKQRGSILLWRGKLSGAVDWKLVPRVRVCVCVCLNQCVFNCVLLPLWYFHNNGRGGHVIYLWWLQSTMIPFHSSVVTLLCVCARVCVSSHWNHGYSPVTTHCRSGHWHTLMHAGEHINTHRHTHTYWLALLDVAPFLLKCLWQILFSVTFNSITLWLWVLRVWHTHTTFSF